MIHFHFYPKAASFPLSFSENLRYDAVKGVLLLNSTRKTTLRVIITILLIAAVLSWIAFAHEMNRLDRDTTGDSHPAALDTFTSTGNEITWNLESVESIREKDVINLLLIGQDRREGQESQMRSDCMIICSIRKSDGTILLSSLMRDMFVPVPEGKYGPLNLTYYAGGMELLDRTIEQDFGIHIDGNLEVDFFRFIALIDHLGGLDLELTQEEADWLNGTTGSYWQSEWNEDAGIDNSGWHLHAGWNSMTAEQVTDYCRLRVVGKSDWERTERQRTVIMEILRKLKQESHREQLSFLHSALPLIRTDLSNWKIFRIGMSILLHRPDSFDSFRVPTEDYYRSANIYSSTYGTLNLLIPDLPKNAAALQSKIYG